MNKVYNYFIHETYLFIVIFLLLPFVAIAISFKQPNFDVMEGNGAVQITLVTTSALECCSFSVQVKVEDITAEGK